MSCVHGCIARDLVAIWKVCLTETGEVDVVAGSVELQSVPLFNTCAGRTFKRSYPQGTLVSTLTPAFFTVVQLNSGRMWYLSGLDISCSLGACRSNLSLFQCRGRCAVHLYGGKTPQTYSSIVSASWLGMLLKRRLQQGGVVSLRVSPLSLQLLVDCPTLLSVLYFQQTTRTTSLQSRSCHGL